MSSLVHVDIKLANLTSELGDFIVLLSQVLAEPIVLLIGCCHTTFKGLDDDDLVIIFIQLLSQSIYLLFELSVSLVSEINLTLSLLDLIFKISFISGDEFEVIVSFGLFSSFLVELVLEVIKLSAKLCNYLLLIVAALFSYATSLHMNF